MIALNEEMRERERERERETERLGGSHTKDILVNVSSDGE
jgi:hypothetical protein